MEVLRRELGVDGSESKLWGRVRLRIKSYMHSAQRNVSEHLLLGISHVGPLRGLLRRVHLTICNRSKSAEVSSLCKVDRHEGESEASQEHVT